ncbi:hypothetical protein FEV13_00385 (plasmid) [Stutzerimonas degradans]|nr:hypothetical protein FEV13_00385 [Stutzerimonas degradans]
MLDWMVLTKFDHDLTPGEASMRLRRWYVAGIIAALFHDAGKPLTDVTVMSFDGTKKWVMGTETIHEWAVANNLTRYFINWERGRQNKHITHTNTLIGIYTSVELRKWLLEGGADIWQALLDAVAGQPGPLTEAVRIADSRSVKADRERGAVTGSNTSTGVPVQRLCVDAMRQLLEDGSWTINQPGSRLWLSTKGLFLAWSTGSDDIIHQVVKDKVGGFPRSENTLLAAMAEYELFEKNTDGSPIWFVAPHPLFKNGKAPSIRCVKFKNPDSVFPFLDGNIGPVSVTIGREDHAKDYLTKEDELARKEREKKGTQEDLFEPSQHHAPDSAAKPRGKSRPQKPAPERSGVSLPPDLESRAAKFKEAQQQPQQVPVPPAAAPAPAEQAHAPSDALDDDTLAAMLHEINGTTPAPAPTQSAIAEEARSSQEEKSPEPSESDEPAQKIKLTFDDMINKKPTRVDKGTAKRAKTTPAPQAQATGALVVPPAFASLLTDQDRQLLQANPELGSRLLEAFAGGAAIKEVRNRAFIPLDGIVTLGDLPDIDRAGWLWRDFTSPDEQITRTLRGVEGFLASKDISLLYCRLSKAQWHPCCLETLPEELHEAAVRMAELFMEAAAEEQERGAGVRSVSFWTREKVAESAGVDLQVADAALMYCLESVRVAREKKFFFQIKRKVNQ